MVGQYLCRGWDDGRGEDVRLLPSLLAWSAVPWRDSEAELKVLEAVSEAELAAFLVDRVSQGLLVKKILLPRLT